MTAFVGVIRMLSLAIIAIIIMLTYVLRDMTKMICTIGKQRAGGFQRMTPPREREITNEATRNN
jgi:hypothetical protein